ncbi:MAG TPA: pentapeptide repeat-containing protein [Candidatus Angelobacter sp.]|nr:pentapeptide repeat-containing protein [Candidatus Angelobacter sp.]
MEWLKAAAVPAAILGAAITLYIGLGEIRQAEQNRDADRFDKALSRLASGENSHRVTGVAGLQLFADDSKSPLQAQALVYLVKALPYQSDESVQGAILDVFKHLKRGQVSQQALNAALESALEENRRLTASILTGYDARVNTAQSKILMKHVQAMGTPNSTPTLLPPFPKELVDQLSPLEYVDYAAPSWDGFERLEPKFNLPLKALAQSVVLFSKLGGMNSDFSGIYCRDCDFSGTEDLSGTKFDASFLSGAQFTRVRLQKASFVNAELGQTVFFSADLSGADLHRDFDSMTFQDLDILTFSTRGLDSPVLECSDLRGANLTGLTLLSVWRDFYDSGKKRTDIYAPALLAAHIDETTHLRSLTVSYFTDISDTYFLNHQSEAVTLPLRKRSGPSSGFDAPLRFNESSAVYLSRDPGNSAAEHPGSTRVAQIEQIALPLESFGFIKQELAELGGYLDQPELMRLPLIMRFNTLIQDSRTGETVQLQPLWKTNRGYSCSDKDAPSINRLYVHGKK